MADMLTLAWEPGDPLSYLHSFIRLDHILTPDTATPCHAHYSYQPRHLPHVIVRFAYDHHGDFERYS